MPTSGTRKGTKKVTKASSWKRNSGVELELPSGNVALCRRPGMDKFLSEGLIPDSLTPIVEKAIKSGKGLSPKQQEEISTDPATLIDALISMDRVLVRCVIEPKVLWHMRPVVPERLNAKGEAEVEEIPMDERDSEKLYTDDVDFDDKVYIFQWAVGGSPDLARFREELGSRMAGVSSGEDVGESA